jgi:hypothetical protein
MTETRIKFGQDDMIDLMITYGFKRRPHLHTEVWCKKDTRVFLFRSGKVVLLKGYNPSFRMVTTDNQLDELVPYLRD